MQYHLLKPLSSVKGQRTNLHFPTGILIALCFNISALAAADPPANDPRVPDQVIATQLTPASQPAVKSRQPASRVSNLAFSRLPPVAAGLTLSASSAQSVAPNQLRYDFGTLNPLDAPYAEVMVHLKNDSTKPMALAALQPSCACTTVTLVTPPSTPASAVQPKTLPVLAPGQQVTMRVQVDLNHVPAGTAHKYVAVFVKDSPRPVAQVEMTGQVQSLVSFTPDALDFAQAQTGKSLSRTVAVSYDPRLSEAGVLPALVSASPDLRVTPVAQMQPNISASAAHGALQTTPSSTAASRIIKTEEYTVTLLPSAALGPLSGSLTFALSPPPASASAKSVFAYEALRRASVPLTGQVVGNVTAQPIILSFGTVSSSQGATRAITLSSASNNGLEKVDVVTASAWVSAKLDQISTAYGFAAPGTKGKDPAGKTVSRRLTVTILPDTPSGLLQTEVKITLAGGQRLLVPVNAYITDQAFPLHTTSF